MMFVMNPLINPPIIRCIFLLFVMLLLPQTIAAQTLGRTALAHIETARNALDASDFTRARTAVAHILNDETFSTYERAIAQHTLGTILATSGDYGAAITAFETLRAQAVLYAALPAALAHDVLYYLAQIHLAAGDAGRAQIFFKQWHEAAIKTKNNIAATAYALSARIHFALSDWGAARLAIERAFSKHKTPAPKDWWHIRAATLLQQQDYPKARMVLAQAVSIFADDKYLWQQLAAVYGLQERHDLAFATYKTMHAQHMLTTSDELVRLAQFYLYYNVPTKAAALLRSHLEKGAIRANAKNYALLAQSYQNARNWQKSIAPLQKAAKMAENTENREYYRQLGLAYGQGQNWARAAAAFEAALNTKNPRKTAPDTWLRLGLARMQLAQWQGAITAFRMAGADDALASQAFQWIRTIEARLAYENRQ